MNEMLSSTGPAIDSRQLRAFVTLSKTASFTVAAQKLFLSQSAVSHSMRALEEDLGCRLLDRVGKKVFLTQAGEQFLQYAESILKQMAEARASLEQLGKWGQTRLRIGAGGTACQYLLPGVIRKLKEQFAQCLVSIVPVDTPESMELLREQKIDFALMLEPDSDGPLDFQPLFSDELFFIVGPDHPWARQGQPSRAEIPKQNYVLYSRKSYTFRLVENYFAEEEMTLNTVIEVGSMEATKEFVKLGLGVSILAPWVAREELANGTLVALPLGRRKLRRTWGIGQRRGARLNLAEETFVKICREVAGQLQDPAPPSAVIRTA